MIDLLAEHLRRGVAEDVLRRAVDPLDRAIEIGRDNGVRSRIDDRVITRILALAQDALAHDRQGDVIDLKQTVAGALGRYGANHHIVQERLPILSIQRQQVVERMRQDARASELEGIANDGGQSRVAQARKNVVEAPPEHRRLGMAGSSTYPLVPADDARALIEHDYADVDGVEGRTIFELGQVTQHCRRPAVSRH